MMVDVPIGPYMPACVDAPIQMDVPACLPANVHTGDGCTCLPEMDVRACLSAGDRCTCLNGLSKYGRWMYRRWMYLAACLPTAGDGCICLRSCQVWRQSNLNTYRKSISLNPGPISNPSYLLFPSLGFLFFSPTPDSNSLPVFHGVDHGGWVGSRSFFLSSLSFLPFFRFFPSFPFNFPFFPFFPLIPLLSSFSLSSFFLSSLSLPLLLLSSLRFLTLPLFLAFLPLPSLSLLSPNKSLHFTSLPSRPQYNKYIPNSN